MQGSGLIRDQRLTGLAMMRHEMRLPQTALALGGERDGCVGTSRGPMGSDEEDRAPCPYSMFYGETVSSSCRQSGVGQGKSHCARQLQGPFPDSREWGDAQCCVKSLVGDPNFRFCGSSMAETSGSWLTACGNIGELGCSVLGGAEI